MLDSYMGNGLPMLITLTGEQAQYLRGRKTLYKYVPPNTAIVTDAAGNALPAGRLRASAGFAAKLREAIAAKQALSPEAIPVTSPGAIQTVAPSASPSAAPLVSPSAIVAETPDSTPFTEQDYEYEEMSPEEAAMEMYPEAFEGEGLKDFLFIVAGAALLYIMAKNKFIRL